MDRIQSLFQHEGLAPRRIGNGPWYPVTENAFKLAYTHLIATLFCQIIAVFFIAARVYTRAFPLWRFTADDYIICVAFASMTVAFGLWYKVNFWAWGGNHPESRHISMISYNTKIGTIAMPFWAWSTGLVKISIGVMLLRFQQSRRWKALVWAMIALNILLILLVGVVNMFACVPYSANWDIQKKMKNRKCWKREINMASIYLSAVLNVLTDVVFSLMPLTFLRKIRRPRSEKVVVGVLMALGLVASTFSLSKSIVNAKIYKSKDTTASLVLLGLLSCLEVQTALIAACAPTLRSAGRRFLQRLGFGQCSEHSSPPPYVVGSNTLRHSKSPHSGIKELDRVHYGRLNSPHEDWEATGSGQDLEEARYVQDPTTGRIICTTELRVHSSHSNLRREWKAHEGSIMEDQWKAQGAIGVAR